MAMPFPLAFRLFAAVDRQRGIALADQAALLASLFDKDVGRQLGRRIDGLLGGDTAEHDPPDEQRPAFPF